MGIYDRDYIRNDPSPTSFGGIRMWSVNTWLIAINVAVFLLDRVLGGMGFVYTLNLHDGQGNVYPMRFLPLEGIGHFSALTAVVHLQIWRFITFQFLHANLEHILFNMISLFFFGPIIEHALGSRRYLAFYLICGIGGAFSYLLLWGLGILGSVPWAPMVGASAGIFGVLIASANIAPDVTVLVYGIIPMRLRVMAWILLAIAAYTVFTGGPNAGGQAAHLGGAVVGFALIRFPQVLRFADVRPRSRMRYRG
jgi:membrane associated rhomboid family serine protease